MLFRSWAGLRLLPGSPEAAAVEIVPAATEDPAKSTRERALILAADAALESPATVVLPPSWYRANRIIELRADKAQSIRLLSLVERGSNFERATYAASAG